MQQTTFEADITIGLFESAALIQLTETLSDGKPEQVILNDIETVGLTDWLAYLPINVTLHPGQYMISGIGKFDDCTIDYSDVKIKRIEQAPQEHKEEA